MRVTLFRFFNLLKKFFIGDAKSNFYGLQRLINKAFNIRPSSYPYVSGDSFRKISKFVIEKPFKTTFLNSHRGDVIFCQTNLVEYFSEHILPMIDQPFILVTHNSDDSIQCLPSSLVNNQYLYRWYAQNCCVTHNKLVNIPIGLENKWLLVNGILRDFQKKDCPKKTRILWGFSTSTNPSERTKAKNVLKKHPLADERWVPPRKYRAVLSEYKFVASPPGNGIDCHRTWEAFYLNVIPIVIRSAVYNGYQNFPALVIDSWEDLYKFSEIDLDNLYEKKIIALREANYLWMDYWVNKINNDRKFLV